MRDELTGKVRPALMLMLAAVAMTRQCDMDPSRRRCNIKRQYLPSRQVFLVRRLSFVFFVCRLVSGRCRIIAAQRPRPTANVPEELIGSLTIFARIWIAR
jgi:hypothetical protein